MLTYRTGAAGAAGAPGLAVPLLGRVVVELGGARVEVDLKALVAGTAVFKHAGGPQGGVAALQQAITAAGGGQ